jgi:hypothetical protein
MEINSKPFSRCEGPTLVYFISLLPELNLSPVQFFCLIRPSPREGLLICSADPKRLNTLVQNSFHENI